MTHSPDKNVCSLSFLKSNFTGALRKVRRSRHPMVITRNGRSAGVLMDIETWEAQMRKLTLLELVNDGEISAKSDGSLSFDEVRTRLKRKHSL